MKSKKNENLKAEVKSDAFGYIHNTLGWDKESIQLNKHAVEKAFKELLPSSQIFFIDGPQVIIHPDNGVPILNQENPTEEELSNNKIVFTGTRKIKVREDFLDIRYKYVYILDCSPVDENGDIWIRFAEYNPMKKIVSFTIDSDLYEKFLDISNKMAINKSKFVENMIKEFVKKVE